MTSTAARDTLAGLATEFAERVDRLQQVDLIPASDDALLEFWRAVEIDALHPPAPAPHPAPR